MILVLARLFRIGAHVSVTLTFAFGFVSATYGQEVHASYPAKPVLLVVAFAPYPTLTAEPVLGRALGATQGRSVCL